MRSPVYTGCGGSSAWKSFGETVCAAAPPHAAARAAPSRSLAKLPRREKLLRYLCFLTVSVRKSTVSNMPSRVRPCSVLTV